MAMPAMSQGPEELFVGSGTGPSPSSGATVLAFGGVVWERCADGIVRLAVVHRPRYGDWSFPKGKVDVGEQPEDTARREVEEETGLRCTLGAYLGELSYPLGGGSTKVVGYWAMTPVARRPRPADEEIDGVEWWTGDEAARQLTHQQDRDLLARFLGLVPEAAEARR